MDKNRLIQIANHFDKIGAYTISDEFENKFIRIAAPADDPTQRRTEVDRRLRSGYRNVISDFIGLFGPMLRLLANSNDLINAKKDSYDLLETWSKIIVRMSADPAYSSKKSNIGKIAASIISAKSNLKTTLPNIITRQGPAANAAMIVEVEDIFGDNDSLLSSFAAYVQSEFTKYDGMAALRNYLIALRGAEVAFYNLAASANLPVPSVPAPVRTPTSPAPATAPSGGGSTAPSGGGSSSKPSGGGSVAPSGGGTTTPSGGGTRPSARPNSGPKPPVAPSGKPSSKTTNLSVNEELSKIVFRKVKASNPKLQDENIFLDMRIDNKYKTYLDVYKDRSLDGSIRAAIKASSFSDEFKQKLIKRLDAKIAKAIELNKAVDPVKPEPVKPEPVKPEPTPGPVDPNKPDPVDPAKPDTDGFRCAREGLFTEIERMDNLHNNDVISYIRTYFANIKRVIDCHESLRNKLNLKDNTQLDSLINILEAKYFSEIHKTSFPF